MASWKKVLVSGSQIDVAGITSSLELAATSVGTGKVVILDGSEFKYTSSAAIGGGGSTTEALTQGTGITDFTFDGGTPNIKVSVSGAASLTDNTLTRWDGDAFVNSPLSSNGTSITSSGLISSSAAITASGFNGNGSGLTNITASKLANALSATVGDGLKSFSYDGTTPISIQVSGAAQLVNNTIVKWNDTEQKFDNSLITEGTNALTFGDGNTNVSIPGNLDVSGTASFTNARSLLVKDQYILLNSGSTSTGDGGVVIQANGTQNIGELLGFSGGSGTEGRWGITASFDAGTVGTFTPTAYMGVVINGTDNNPGSNTTANNTKFKNPGNIYIDTNATDAEGGVWIYV